MEIGDFRPKIFVSESLRVTPQGLLEDHRRGGVNDWLWISHAVCLHAGTGTSLCLCEVSTECRSNK